MTYLKFFFTIIAMVSILGCKSKTNQIVNKLREGKWITIDTLDCIYITKGKFHNGNEVGTWKYFYNEKMVRKEKYHTGICTTTFYHPNGKIMKKGNTRLDSNGKEDHWYYFGKWCFYNTKGKLDYIKIYQKEEITQ